MTRDQFDARVRAVLGPAAVQTAVPLADFSTFRVGGPAEWLLVVRTVDHLLALLDLCREADVPLTLLGGGSNVVIADEGIPGAVVRLQLTGITKSHPNRVRAEAGVTINGLVRWMIGRGLAGLEAWAGTPGTVGGAVYGNAHYSGQNIGELVRDVLVVSRDGRVEQLAQAQMEFAYDTSRLRRSGEIMIWAEFAAAPAAPEALRARARESLAFRKRTQPLAMPSAGCVFQNPDPARDPIPDGIPASAGALIDRAGLKGFRIGDAVISPTHANFVVNEGRATARDVRAVIETARAAVRDRFGVELRDEVVFLGRF